MIQYIEEVGAEFNQLRLGQGEALSQRYIHIALTWPAEYVATHIADVSGGFGGRVKNQWL